jgi:putative N6-adenine-specific DNA methylase
MSRLEIFVACPPNLEELTRQELFALGINQPSVLAGGVQFTGFLRHLYHVNLWSRLASHVLVRVGSFYASTFSELVSRASHLAWEEILRVDLPLAVRVTCHKSKLYHTDGVAERVRAAIHKRLGMALRSAQNDLPAQQVVVRLAYDTCTISIDSSGEHLHQRGYRLQTAKAPIRENLAAAVLAAVGYQPEQALLDPTCGAGTFPIEAALLASHTPPGLRREFAFQEWQNFDPAEWNLQLEQAEAGIRPPTAPIVGSDRDAGAVAVSQANAERAGVAQWVEWQCKPLSAVQAPPGWDLPPSAGCLIANLPYGLRIGDTSQLRNLYASFGQMAQQRFAHWQVAFLCNSPSLAHATQLPLQRSLSFENGGEKVGLYVK